eukprot:scaffold125650_cov59-Phaeocystis_antarctica.AAC.1
MILHVAHSKFLRPRAEGGGSLGLSPGVGEHIIAEVDAGRRHLGEVAVHLRRRGVVVGVVVGAVVVPLVAALALGLGVEVELG